MSSENPAPALNPHSQPWMRQSIVDRYSYHFSYLGRPIIQYPQDMVATQELIWKTRPDLIIETGIAHGGSLVMSASMLALLDYCDCVDEGGVIDPQSPRRKVVGVDIDIRQHNREALDAHPMRHRIEMIEGSSIAAEIVEQVGAIADGYERVLVCLDSNHTHEHALAELQAYAPMVSSGSYCIVFDTIIELLAEESYPDRPWGPGDNPMTAVEAFLKANQDFEIDHEIDSRLQLSVAPSGYLRRV